MFVSLQTKFLSQNRSVKIVIIICLKRHPGPKNIFAFIGRGEGDQV